MPNNRYIITGYEQGGVETKGTAVVFDAHTGEIVQDLFPDEKHNFPVHVLSDGKHIAMSYQDEKSSPKLTIYDNLYQKVVTINDIALSPVFDSTGRYVYYIGESPTTASPDHRVIKRVDLLTMQVVTTGVTDRMSDEMASIQMERNLSTNKSMPESINEASLSDKPVRDMLRQLMKGREIHRAVREINPEIVIPELGHTITLESGPDNTIVAVDKDGTIYIIDPYGGTTRTMTGLKDRMKQEGRTVADFRMHPYDKTRFFYITDDDGDYNLESGSLSGSSLNVVK